MAIVRGLCTLPEARVTIFGASEATADTSRDPLIEDYVSAATNVIENLPGVGPQVAESRTLTFDGGGHVLVLPFRINAVTSVTVNGVAYTSFVSELRAGLIHAGTTTSDATFAAGTQNVVVVVTVGNATVPPNVKLAARELVRHWWQQGQQGNRPGFGDGSSEPAVQFGVPTRRLMELLGSSSGVAGFA